MENSSKKNDFENEINKLKSAYLESLPERIQSIAVIWSSLSKDLIDKDKLKLMVFELHRLAGSGTTFGFAKLSELAKAAEKNATISLQSDSNENECYQSLAISVEELLGLLPDQKQLNLPVQASKPLALKPIYIFHYKHERTLELIDELKSRNYQVISYESQTDLLDSLKVSPPGLVILELEFVDNQMSDFLLLSRIRDKLFYYSPAIFLSNVDSIEARLAAIKAGGDAFFTPNFSMPELLTKIDQTTARLNLEPYRVLVVDDDEILTQVYRRFLQKAGFEVDSINNPLQVIKKLEAFEPEVILLDYDMPLCSGLELAKLLQQHGAYPDLNIIFLTANESQELGFTARQYGVDDFLTKPIEEEHLIKAVLCRAQKSRMFRKAISG